MKTSEDTVDTSVFLNREDIVTDSHSEVATVEELEKAVTTTWTFYEFTASSEVLSADDYVLNLVGNGADVVTGDLNVSGDSGGSSRTVYFESFVI